MYCHIATSSSAILIAVFLGICAAVPVLDSSPDLSARTVIDLRPAENPSVSSYPSTSSFSAEEKLSQKRSSFLLHSRDNHCGDSTFENRVSSASPSVADCRQLAENIKSDDTWLTWNGGHTTLVKYGSCAFGVEGEGFSSLKNFYVGNEDIRDLIFDSIARFEWEGKVGSRGVVQCQDFSSFAKNVKVEWGIFHT